MRTTSQKLRKHAGPSLSHAKLGTCDIARSGSWGLKSATTGALGSACRAQRTSQAHHGQANREAQGSQLMAAALTSGEL
jgi:hypothetical protein